MRILRILWDVTVYSWMRLWCLAKEEQTSFVRLYLMYIDSFIRAHIYVDEFVCIRREKVVFEERDAYVASVVESRMKMRLYKRNYYENFRFLSKYSSMKYDGSYKKIKRRISEYASRYHMGKGCWVQYGVTITCEHYSDETVKIGDGVLLARDVDLDFTGGLEIGNDVKIMEGVKILTHAHDMLHMKADSKLIPHSNRAYKTPLRIGNNVQIASRAQILPGVREIGENSMISAGSVVTKKVPPRVVIAGNPAKIVAEIPEESILKAEVV